MYRLFVAIAPPDAVRARLQGLCAGLPGARWVAPEQMHLTLRFIGAADGAAQRDIADALGEVDVACFSVQLEGVGHFPPRGRAKVLWAGVAPNPALIALRDQVEATLVRHGFAPEGRNYAPHVTLARFRTGARAPLVAAYLAHHGLFQAAPFEVAAFHLVSSHLTPSGAHYAIEASYPLRGAP